MKSSCTREELLKQVKNGDMHTVIARISAIPDTPDKLHLLLNLQIDLFNMYALHERFFSITNLAFKSAQTQRNLHAERIFVSNLAQYCLPWWNKTALLSSEERQLGFEAAQKLASLAAALVLASADLSLIHWILAGHFLYSTQTEPALHHFQTGLSLAIESETSDLIALNMEGIGRTFVLLLPEKRDEGITYLQQAHQRYAQENDDCNLLELQRFCQRERIVL